MFNWFALVCLIGLPSLFNWFALVCLIGLPNVRFSLVEMQE